MLIPIDNLLFRSYFTLQRNNYASQIKFFLSFYITNVRENFISSSISIAHLFLIEYVIAAYLMGKKSIWEEYNAVTFCF